MIGVLIARGVNRKLEIGRAFSLTAFCFGLYGALAVGLEPWLLGLTLAGADYAFLSRETLTLSVRSGLATALFCVPTFAFLDRLIRPKEPS
jgi:hypothetical protein